MYFAQACDNSMHADLHCHTTASDGALSPQDILQLAFENGLDMLAITDHDTLDGYFEAKTLLEQTPASLNLSQVLKFHANGVILKFIF